MRRGYCDKCKKKPTCSSYRECIVYAELKQKGIYEEDEHGNMKQKGKEITLVYENIEDASDDD